MSVQFDLETDVVVVGSGAGGLSAAITAATAGRQVIVLEKANVFGGSTAISGGVIWIPENLSMAQAGKPDEPGAAGAYLRAFLGPQMREDMIAAFVDNGRRMIEFFNAETEVKTLARMYAPDYRPNLPGASLGGRGLDPVEYDGRMLGSYLRRLKPPLTQMTIFNGMMVNRVDMDHLMKFWRSWPAFTHSCRIVLKYLLDRVRYGRSTRLLAGNALAARLLRSALDRGVTLFENTRLVELITEGREIAGVVAESGGRRQNIKARLGVVLASGGFAANSDWRATLVPHAAQHMSMAPDSNVGESLAIAQAVGAAIDESNVGNVLLAPVSILEAPDGRKVQFPHLILDRQKPGLIAVNQRGLRFVNEADSYHDFVLGMYRQSDGQASIPAYLICDSRFIAKYGLGLVRPFPFPKSYFIRAGYLIKAPTIKALAERLAIPATRFEETIAKANLFSREGHDPDFGKGDSEYNRYLGDPLHRPNPCLGPIETAPFYAVTIFPGDIGSCRGLRTDVNARVLDREGEPLPRLYACGNDMNSIMGGHYPAGGITLGPAMTFGFIAARHLTRTNF